MATKFYPDDRVKAFIDSTVLHKTTPINQIALEGAPGCGKTALAYHIAEELKIPTHNVLRLVCTKQTTFEQFTFEKTAKEGTIFEIQSKFLELVQKPSVILIDEYKLAQPDIIAGLNSLTDFEQAYVHHDGRIFKRHPQNVIIFSTNPESYAGCKRQHGGFVDRLPTITLDYSPKEALIVKDNVPSLTDNDLGLIIALTKLVRNAVKTSGLTSNITTRGMISMAQLISNGLSFDMAAMVTLRPFNDEVKLVEDLIKMASGFECSKTVDKSGKEFIEFCASGGGSLKNLRQELEASLLDASCICDSIIALAGRENASKIEEAKNAYIKMNAQLKDKFKKS